MNQPDNRRPHKEIPHEGKDRTRQEDHPRPTKTTAAVAIERDVGVEEARKNAGDGSLSISDSCYEQGIVGAVAAAGAAPHSGICGLVALCQ